MFPDLTDYPYLNIAIRVAYSAFVIFLLIYFIYGMTKKCVLESFSPSTKPFEADNTLMNRNPFDDVDYQTPRFYRVQRRSM